MINQLISKISKREIDFLSLIHHDGKLMFMQRTFVGFTIKYGLSVTTTHYHQGQTGLNFDIKMSLKFQNEHENDSEYRKVRNNNVYFLPTHFTSMKKIQIQKLPKPCSII